MKKLFVLLLTAILLCSTVALAREVPVTFAFSHIGINNGDDAQQTALRDFFENALQFHDTREIAVSHYVADDNVELLKGSNHGARLHIGLYVQDIVTAKAYLESQGYTFDESSAKFKDDGVTMRLIYMNEEFNGVGFHLTTSIPTLLDKQDPMFAFSHVGINNYDQVQQDQLRDFFENTLNFHDTREIAVSHYVADNKIELLKATNYGENCHVGIYTKNIADAMAYLEGLGYTFDLSTMKYQEDGVTPRLVYMTNEFNGVGFHLTTTP